MQIKFIDKNKSLVSKIRKAVKYLPFKITVKCGDIFAEKGVIVSASNPMFSMGGGLDALIAEKYPEECEEARKTPGEMKRIGNIIFCITVDENLQSNRDLVTKALSFALNQVKENEAILISGLGCGIGNLK